MKLIKEFLRVVWLEAKYQAKRLVRKLTYDDYEANLQFWLDIEHYQRNYTGLPTSRLFKS